MEDYSPTPAEVEETPVKRRRFLRGNFLSSWLDHRNEVDDDETGEVVSKKKKKSKNKSTKTPESNNQDWLPERWRDRFKNFFSGLVSLEMVPVGVNVNERQSVETAEIGSTDVAEQEPIAHDETGIPPIDDGLLAVSSDAQRRYYGNELNNESEGDDVELGVEVDDEETDKSIEYSRLPSEGFESDNSQNVESRRQSSRVPEQSSAEPLGEVLQRRQAERLELRVKKLKKQAKSLKLEQNEINSKQKAFAKELNANQAARERFDKVTVPKLENDRLELQKRLETPSIKREKPERKAVIAESNQLPPRVKSEYELPARPNLELKHNQVADYDANTSPSEKLEKILNVAEPETGFSESVYEKRHEIKDEPGSNQTNQTAKQSWSTTHSRPVPETPPPFRQPPMGKIPSIPTQPQKPLAEFNPPDSLYRQAVITGAISGIGLTILIALIVLLMRY